MAHNFFRTQKSQNYTEFTTHGARAKRLAVLCIPWILCETPHTRFFTHRNHRITQNLLRMVFCVRRKKKTTFYVFRGFCVKHYTQEFSHTDSTELHRNLLATLVFHSAWCESKAPLSSVYSVDSV